MFFFTRLPGIFIVISLECSKKTQKQTNKKTKLCSSPLCRICLGKWSIGNESRYEAALWSGGTAADTCVSFARRLQGEQTVAAVDGVFSYPLGSVQKSHFTEVTDAVDIVYSV